MIRALPVLLLALTGFAIAEGSADFRITQTTPIVSTSTVSGKESYKVSASESGITLTSHLWVAEGETPVLSQVEETFGPDWMLKHYTFDGVVGGIKQKIEAWVDGDKLRMQATSGRMNPQRTVDLLPNTIVLDNFVPSHFQVLLNQFNKNPAKMQLVCVVVPQKLLALKGTLTRAGHDTGTLYGQTVTVNKYLLKTPAGMSQIWANEANELLGVYFKDPDIEYLRTGFDLPQLTLATRRKLPSETPAIFTSHDRQVLGSLMLPPEQLGRKEKNPLVVMVGGFGPVDRDETIGRSKPLYDIAVALAQKGYASLRYDKLTRTFHGQLDYKSLTVEQEVIDVAAAAIEYARTLRQVDAESVFLLGYSQGGELAPFILRRVNDVRGVILLASPARSPDEFIPQQFRAGLAMKNTPPEKIEAQVASVKNKFAAIRAGTVPDSDLVLGYSARYWRQLMAMDNVLALRQVDVPMLVLQGERDSQLSKQDFDIITGTIPSAKLESTYFSGLDHIFIPAPEDSSGAEMLIGGHVAQEVTDRLTTWLQAHRVVADDSSVSARAGKNER